MAKSKKIKITDLVNKIEKLSKERMAKEKVVSLNNFRDVKNQAEPFTLLLIEDDETIRTALKRIFESEGYKVISAADGTQLSQVVDDSPIDMVILDVGLPWINGYELAEMMKAHPDLKGIPLIFISGRVSDEDVKRGFQVGADDFIKKPFDLEKIKKTVRTLLKLANG